MTKVKIKPQSKINKCINNSSTPLEKDKKYENSIKNSHYPLKKVIINQKIYNIILDRKSASTFISYILLFNTTIYISEYSIFDCV
jgi:hypothetical protein